MKSGGRRGGQAQAWNKGKTKFDDKRILKQAISMLGNGNHFYGQQHSNQTIETLKISSKITQGEFKARLKARESDFIISTNFSYEEYESRQYQKLPVECTRCHRTSYKTLQSLERGTLCKFCYPFTVSRGELELGNYVESKIDHDVVRNDRTVIAPYELDIYVPKLHLAIEYHGVYWHMDKGQPGFDKKLHYKKHLHAKNKGIKLLQFYSNQWEQQSELVKSMIDNQLGLNAKKVGARTLQITMLDSKAAKAFFTKNHLHGWCRAKATFALTDKETNEVLSALSLRSPMHKVYKDSLEIARFATRMNTTVVGGFSKLLSCVKKYTKSQQLHTIISYADLLHGTGRVYDLAGFDYVKHTGINYWYTDGVQLFNRFRYKAEANKSEKEVAKAQNVQRIYGCGNSLYKLALKVEDDA